MISPKWSKLAESILGNKEGKYCHWCKFINCHDGIAECSNPKSKFCDDDRIRTWDGLECASECGLFKLDDWYIDDKNYEATFNIK